MVALPKEPYFSPDEYLQIEEQSPIKHEYIDGRLYAMVGASQAHNTLTGNLFAALHGHIRGSECRVFMSDMKVHVAPRNRYYYPDAVVSCDPRDRETPISLHFPSVIVEILSDSTEAFDQLWFVRSPAK